MKVYIVLLVSPYPDGRGNYYQASLVRARGRMDAWRQGLRLFEVDESNGRQVLPFDVSQEDLQRVDLVER